MSRRGKPPLMDCPECEKPAVAADFYDDELGWRWMDGEAGECPSCKVKLRVSCTDDYAEDSIASLKVVYDGDSS